MKIQPCSENISHRDTPNWHHSSQCVRKVLEVLVFPRTFHSSSLWSLDCKMFKCHEASLSNRTTIDLMFFLAYYFGKFLKNVDKTPCPPFISLVQDSLSICGYLWASVTAFSSSHFLCYLLPESIIFKMVSSEFHSAFDSSSLISRSFLTMIRLPVHFQEYSI